MAVIEQAISAEILVFLNKKLLTNFQAHTIFKIYFIESTTSNFSQLRAIPLSLIV